MQRAHFQRHTAMSTRKPASTSADEASEAKRITKEAPPVEPDQQPRHLDDCRRCALWSRATQAVGGVGPKHAPIMMVGEQPGDTEDLQGMPFVGPAGQLLDDALKDAGVARQDVYVT